jgi:hypothetical protein
MTMELEKTRVIPTAGVNKGLLGKLLMERWAPVNAVVRGSRKQGWSETCPLTQPSTPPLGATSCREALRLLGVPRSCSRQTMEWPLARWSWQFDERLGVWSGRFLPVTALRFTVEAAAVELGRRPHMQRGDQVCGRGRSHRGG